MPIAGANMVRKDFRGALFSLLGLFAGTDAGANTLVVTDLGDATGDLVCDAQCTLREAIAAASSGDTITWSSTLPFPATTLLVAGSGGLLIDKNLTLLGPGAHQLTLDAQNASRVLTLAALGGLIWAVCTGPLRAGRALAFGPFLAMAGIALWLWPLPLWLAWLGN